MWYSKLWILQALFSYFIYSQKDIYIYIFLLAGSCLCLMFIFLRALFKEILVAADDNYKNQTKYKLFCKKLNFLFTIWRESSTLKYLTCKYGELRIAVFCYCQCWQVIYRLTYPGFFFWWPLLWALFLLPTLTLILLSNSHFKHLPQSKHFYIGSQPMEWTTLKDKL